MINGISFLRKMYPGRDNKDYQPSGLDLRVGEVFVLDESDEMLGIYNNQKTLPNHIRYEPEIVCDEGKEIQGWRLKPNRPYIFQVQDQIRIGDHNAQFYLPRSTLLRAGVNVYTALGDLGYNGHLSFLVINHNYLNPFFIEKGERFAQLVDFEVQGGKEGYQGDYQEEEC